MEKHHKSFESKSCGVFCIVSPLNTQPAICQNTDGLFFNQDKSFGSETQQAVPLSV